MPINPILIASEIEARFRRYLLTTFDFPSRHSELRAEFREAIHRPERLFRGPYLHGLAPYVQDLSVADLVRLKVLPDAAVRLPLLNMGDRPLYRHQVRAIQRIRAGRNAIVSSGTGSGKTLAFLAPILAAIIENPEPGVHALLLYPMNALVNDQLKNLRRVLRDTPTIRFGRYINVEVTPTSEKDARRLHPEAPANEVVSREEFRTAPPHLLVTNYAMLEYLLLRVDDSPLFSGPWRFIVVDEAHTYSGAKGSEVALLLRRLQSRVKLSGDRPPQFIATSATLGTNDQNRRAEVLSFARNLFAGEFTEDDLILAEKQHAPAEGGVQPDNSVYTDPIVMAACDAGAKWSADLTAVLIRAGFSTSTVELASRQLTVEEGLYQVFREDSRAVLLREAADIPRDLRSSANLVFGRSDSNALEQLCGLVRICSLARLPGGDARLVPCRYHFFVRGLNGAYVALEKVGQQTIPELFLDPIRQTQDGRRTLELCACRRCGQPYVTGYVEVSAGKQLLGSLKGESDQSGKPLWFAWEPPVLSSEDEKDEANEDSTAKQMTLRPTHGYTSTSGEVRLLGNDSVESDALPLWLIDEGPELNRCFACGGSNSVTRVQADADAAQAVVADAFYRSLPEATCPPAKPDVHLHPGRGRKLLAFADSRQSAAYFAPYLENSNNEQVLRRLILQSIKRAERRLGEAVDAETLVSQMKRLANDDRLFEASLSVGKRDERCRRAVVAEFCLPFGRRQSLEALALTECRVQLQGRWERPDELLKWLNEAELETVVQVLLATLRLVKAIELPDPLSPDDPAFRFQSGPDATIARGSEHRSGMFRLHGFAPERAPHLQRRSGYLLRVMQQAALRGGLAEPPPEEIAHFLDKIWMGLVHSSHPVLSRAQVMPGIVGHQIRWDDLCFQTDGDWFICDSCQQWVAHNVLGVCPSFRCNGRLRTAIPDELLIENHYRRTYSLSREAPVPLVAKEHTAQLGPKLATEYQLAFQNGDHPDVGQINVLSSSTTFELGVDLGDLEAVFLRNMPPSPANYQQRAGRAGRGIGSAAFSVTFAMPRSHDEHFFANPAMMIDGMVRPPRIDLSNQTIYMRHAHAVLLADFVHGCAQASGVINSTIGQLLQTSPAGSPLDAFLLRLPNALERNKDSLRALIPCERLDHEIATKGQSITLAFDSARQYFSDEVQMYNEAIEDTRGRLQAAKAAGDHQKAHRIHGFETFLLSRLSDLHKQDWVTFFSDRSVLPSYAFPIYNVSLETADRDLKLDRDLRIALSEYVPGAAIVAKGRLWRSIGIRKPWQKSLERKFYARCPNCWHVMQHLDVNQVFPDVFCPVCKHDGRSPVRRKHAYLVPQFGFTTDLTTNGEELTFDRPVRIPASHVLFVPQQQVEDHVRNSIGVGTIRVDVRTTEQADFFVFNDGDEPDGRGFRLCTLCGCKVELESTGRGKNRSQQVKAHRTSFGKDCNGTSYELVHLGHDFISCAARLTFSGQNRDYADQPFWLSLLYSILGGMADSLGIDANDINGVIRPIDLGGVVAQEVVIFDDVPGGAGHALRLESQDELLQVLQAAHSRVANCTCDETASCYTCLRSYKNQFCHDQLARGPVVDYLDRLLSVATVRPDDDQPYLLPDRAAAIRTAIRDSVCLDVITDRLTAEGPPETGPWFLHLLEAAVHPGARIRIAIGNKQLAAVPRDGLEELSSAHLIALAQAGATLYRTLPDAPPPPYCVLALGPNGEPQSRSVGFYWSNANHTIPLDADSYLQPMWFNRSSKRLPSAWSANEAWFTEHAVPLTVSDLFQSSNACTAHTIALGDNVDFARLFCSLQSRTIATCHLQDPYLQTGHQMKCLAKFLQAIPWPAGGEQTRFKLITQLSDSDPRERNLLTSTQQKQEIENRLAAIGALKPTVEFRYRKYHPLHMRFVHFGFVDGEERLYILERGLDIEDPRSEKARANTFVLEFPSVSKAMADLLGIS